MQVTNNRQVIDLCNVLLKLIETDSQPRIDCGICSNFTELVDNPSPFNGYQSRRFREFLHKTGRSTDYPIEEQMFPHFEPDQLDELYGENSEKRLLWKGDARKTRIALLHEFIAWLEQCNTANEDPDNA